MYEAQRARRQRVSDEQSSKAHLRTKILNNVGRNARWQRRKSRDRGVRQHHGTHAVANRGLERNVSGRLKRCPRQRRGRCVVSVARRVAKSGKVLDDRQYVRGTKPIKEGHAVTRNLGRHAAKRAVSIRISRTGFYCSPINVKDGSEVSVD